MLRLFVALLLLPFTLAAQISGKVVHIADGDTFTILTSDKKQIKVSLYAIDAPEKKQPYGQQAKAFLSEAILGDTVSIYPKDTAKGHVVVALVYSRKVKILNTYILENGYAWQYKKYNKDPLFAQFENIARHKKAGLWADANPIAPWDWRKAKGKKKKLEKLQPAVITYE